MHTIAVLLFFLLTFFPAYLFATTPVISNVSGTVSQGSTLTITGTTMMDEVKTHWVSGLQSGTNYGFEGTIGTFWINANSGNGQPATFDTSVKLSGSKSLKCRTVGGPTGDTNDGGSRVWFDATSVATSYYWRFYSRWDAVSNIWPDQYTKLIFTGYEGTQWYWELSGGSVPSGAPTNWYAKWSGSDISYPSVDGGSIQSGRWYCIEGQWTNSPKVMRVWVDGVEKLNVTPSTTFGNTYPEIGIINSSTSSNVVDLTNYIDNFAFSSTGRIRPSAIIEISDNSEYASGTKVWQPPTSLSDGTITVTCNLTGLSGTDRYLWVTNNKGERSLAYTLSGSGDTTPPVLSPGAPPSGTVACPASPVSVTFGVDSDDDSTVKYDTSDKAYASMANTFASTGGKVHRTTASHACGASYTYYARGTSAGGTNTSSTTISFTISAESPPPAPAAPVLTDPADDATDQETTVTLDWNASVEDGSHGAADSYRAQVATDSGFSTVIYDQSGITATAQAVSGLSYSTTYYWRVNATNSGGDSSWSSTRSLTVKSAPTGENLLIETFDDGTINWSFDGTSIATDSTTKYAGTSSAKFAWVAGQSKPTGVTSYRYEFPTPQESIYMSFYWRFDTSWQGSGASYHPHLIMINSDLDMIALDGGDWNISWNYLNTYTEVSNLTPRFIIQDGKNVNASYGSLPRDLTAITEDRDTAGCNGCKSGSDCGTSYTCYDCGGGDYCNGRTWDGTSNYSKNTWHKTEVYYKLNTITSGVANADGILWYKIDNVLVINKSNVIFRAGTTGIGGFSQFILAPYIETGSGSPYTQTMWMDELIVATDAPGTSDTNAPTVTITTTSPQNIAGDSLGVTGTASDDVWGTGSVCKWRVGTAPDANNGTTISGLTYSGTVNWSCNASGFFRGSNTLYVGCGDAGGNWSYKSMIVDYRHTAQGISGVTGLTVR